MKHALVSGQIYRNDDGSTDIEILTQIDNDNGITDIFDDVDHALLEQLEPNFVLTESYFFIAFVESEFVAYNTQEGTDYVIEHDVTEIKSFKDLPQAIGTTEILNEVKADKCILTEEELKERNRLLVLENDELNAEVRNKTLALEAIGMIVMGAIKAGKNDNHLYTILGILKHELEETK